MKKNLLELSIEVEEASDMIIGLSLQFDEYRADRLTPEVMRGAMLGVARYLDRISDDIEYISEQRKVKAYE